MNEAEDTTCLLHLLNRLVVALEPTRNGDSIPPACRSTALERWEDKDYVYVETNLGSVPESDVDISILGDLVFIRIGRRTLPSRRVEADVSTASCPPAGR
jgi:hypothetical protein